jgi:integrase
MSRSAFSARWASGGLGSTSSKAQHRCGVSWWALRLTDLDPANRLVHVRRKFAELQNGERVAGRPKSDAGFRTVALPPVLVDVMHEHLDGFPAAGAEGLVFTGPKGAPLSRNIFHRSVSWADCVTHKSVGLPIGFRFHDLRHTGNTLAAASGASTRELMHRMGHASMRVALIYRHATSAPDREIADALGGRIARHHPRCWPNMPNTTAGGREQGHRRARVAGRNRCL